MPIEVFPPGIVVKKKRTKDANKPHTEDTDLRSSLDLEVRS